MIRKETAADHAAIRKLTIAAFEASRFGYQGEAEIVEGLRTAGALTLSLVDDRDGAIAGHIAFSPVTVEGASCDWYGLAPVSVAPDHQGQGIGAGLIREGLAQLKALGAQGCVLLGDPAYYGRFGFQNVPRLTLAGVPPEYFQALPFTKEVPQGAVAFHAAFGG